MEDNLSAASDDAFLKVMNLEEDGEHRHPVEIVIFSSVCQKINNLGISQERNLILSSKHIYSFKKKSKVSHLQS